MDKKNKKGALEFSFSWIFAIVAGAFILFLTIFAIIKITNINNTVTDTTTAKTIEVLLNPLESSFETGTKTSIKTPLETRIYAGCSLNGNFGKQTIRTNQLIRNKWTETNIGDITFSNKYIFSKEYVEGKKFYIYSKPFEFPFKIADLLYITSSKDIYCFIGSPDRIENEITDWNSENLVFKEVSSDCPEDSINVCFKAKANCDVVVDEQDKSVKKGNDLVYYEGDSLMYAAIFSDKEIYECQLNRLMKRAEQLSLLYQGKSTFLLQKVGCEASIISDLIVLSNLERSFKSSGDLAYIVDNTESIQTQNERGECRLW
jgi:hypothetical protein